MKKIIPILFLLFTLNSFSQTYFPFPDSIGVWRETNGYDDPPLPIVQNHYSIFINGDTIINANLYKKLYEYASNFTIVIDTTNSTYYGALREVNKRIYFYPDTNYNFGFGYGFCYEYLFPNPPYYNEEILLYDFNVSTGDTVFYPLLDSTFLVINSIDSVLIQSQYRKRYNYSYSFGSSYCRGSYTSSYVEGIGNIQDGLFALLNYYFENFQYLRCFEDDEVSYSPIQIASCQTIGVSIEELNNENALNIYPNPATINLTIEFINPTGSLLNRIALFDISGKEVYSAFLNSTKSSIDVTSFKKSLYLLKITSKNGTSKTTLVSIQ